jgi:hypothetical protein
MIDAKKLPKFLQRIILTFRCHKHGRLYHVKDGSLLCYVCGKTSDDPLDIRYRFCIECGFLIDAAKRLHVPREHLRIMGETVCACNFPDLHMPDARRNSCGDYIIPCKLCRKNRHILKSDE